METLFSVLSAERAARANLARAAADHDDLLDRRNADKSASHKRPCGCALCAEIKAAAIVELRAESALRLAEYSTRDFYKTV